MALTAKDLWRAFHDNQVAAEIAFSNRPLLVTGDVDHVDRDYKGRIRVHLKVDLFHSVRVFFPERRRGEVINLQPGKSIVVPSKISSLSTA